MVDQDRGDKESDSEEIAGATEGETAAGAEGQKKKKKRNNKKKGKKPNEQEMAIADGEENEQGEMAYLSESMHGGMPEVGEQGLGVDPEALAEITRTVQVEMAQQVQQKSTNMHNTFQHSDVETTRASTHRYTHTCTQISGHICIYICINVYV